MSILTPFAKFVPAISWMRSYNNQMFKGDLNAGITVGIMLIPQGMAYAVLAGLPPVYGLYASIVPILLYALMGTSRQLAVGPVAMVSLLVLAGVGEFAEAGSERFIQLAILTALGVGVIQLLMGLFKMGFLVNFLSHPVLAGFTSAAAIIIAASQLKSLLGLDIPGSKMVFEVIMNATANISDANLFTTAIGVGSIALILYLRSWKRTFPSALAVVLLGTLGTWYFGLHAHGVHIVGEIPGGLPNFSTPNFSFADISQLMPIILVISLVGYMESIAVAKSIANKHGYKIDPNQELIALGTANIGGSLFQSFPTTGGLSRTAVNNQAGSVSGMASIISASIIILTLLFLTPLFYYLPTAVLAAIIIVAVSSLFDWQTMRHLMKTDKRDLSMLSVTFLSTLFLGIEEGIAIGVFVSLTMLIYQSTRPHSAVLGQLGKSNNYRNVLRYPEADTSPDLLIFRFDSPLFFTNATAFADTLGEQLLRKGPDLKHLILDASAMTSIDSTGIHAIEELIKEMKSRGANIYIAGAIGPFRDKLMRCGLIEGLGVGNFYFDVAEAVESIKGNLSEDRRFGFHPNQTNIR
jgi:sulfate permease, SulP family